MPLAKVYAWRLTHHPELGVYRAMLWMELPYKDAEKCRYDKYIPVSIASSKERMLHFLKVALKAELESTSKKGLQRL